MADLIARTALAGQGPVTWGGLTLREVTWDRITSVAPFRGADVGALLDWPAPNRVVARDGGRIVWTGPGQAFLFGPVPEGLADHAALTDQSDGWAGLALEGKGAAEVLARLVPLDLDTMGPGEASRTLLGHMNALIIRVGTGFEALVFRSMARTAWHDIEAAMRGVAARQRR